LVLLSLQKTAKMNKFFLFILMIISFISCINKKKEIAKDSILIQGKIINGNEKQLILQILNYNNKQIVDSVYIKEDGSFSFLRKAEEKSIFLLQKDDNHYITIIADKEDTIHIETDFEQFEKKYSIQGSEESKLLCEFNTILQKNQNILDSIGKVWETAINKPNRIEIKQQLDTVFFNTSKKQYFLQKEFVEKNSSSLAALIVLYLPLGREAVLRETTDFKLFEKVSNDISKALPNNSHSLNFAKRIKQKKMLELEKELSEKN
jgi:hypothetical protein